MTKDVRWFEELWRSLSVFVFPFCSRLIRASFSVIVLQFLAVERFVISKPSKS
jgi:hypothetical protein